MAISEVSICNSAIAKIGGQRLVSLDDANERARLFKEQYPKIRDELLVSHPWSFATKRAAPAGVVLPPNSLYEYKFQLPLDCLRVIDVAGKTSVWSTEDGFLLADHPDPVIKYIAQVTDVSKFPPAFSEVLAAKLAADTCYSLVQSVTLRQQLIAEYEKALRLARSYNAQEASSERVYADDWLRARGSYGAWGGFNGDCW